MPPVPQAPTPQSDKGWATLAATLGFHIPKRLGAVADARRAIRAVRKGG